MAETQEQIDRAYAEGKAAYLRDVGTHGPTLRQTPRFYTANPYPRDTKLRLSWQRGYDQDTRRVIADLPKRQGGRR